MRVREKNTENSVPMMSAIPVISMAIELIKGKHRLSLLLILGIRGRASDLDKKLSLARTAVELCLSEEVDSRCKKVSTASAKRADSGLIGGILFGSVVVVDDYHLLLILAVIVGGHSGLVVCGIVGVELVGSVVNGFLLCGLFHDSSFLSMFFAVPVVSIVKLYGIRRNLERTFHVLFLSSGISRDIVPPHTYFNRFQHFQEGRFLSYLQ